MMGKVIDVRFRQPSERGIYFPPRDLYFPPLWRLVVTWNTNLEAFGIDTPDPPQEPSVMYTIDPTMAEQVHGSAETQVVGHVFEEDGQSLVIRHHLSHDVAMSVLDGALDSGIPERDIDSIVQTREGFFTMIRRPTPKHGKNGEDAKDGPFVFHVGLYKRPTSDWGIVDDAWECRTDRFGRTVVDELLHEFCELVGDVPGQT